MTNKPRLTNDYDPMTHELLMQRALELAQLGQGAVSPNPMVGCVMVYKGQVIGEGWHKKYGGWHAEVNAVNSVQQMELLKESTVYVTLEPCSHFGKTPPCADLLIRHQVKKVVICNVDTNPLVGGKGIARLQQAGIEVETGVLESQGRALNKRFFTFMEKKRPYIILKWAQTADGFIARENFDSKWISNDFSRTLVHKWRTEEEAILVGTSTALYDNPKLNVRNWQGKNPLRLVIDLNLRLPAHLHLFDRKQPTLCYNLHKAGTEENLTWVPLHKSDNSLQEILQDLYARKIQSVIVEGGSKLLNSFIEQGLWDEARIFESPQVFGNGIAAPVLRAKAESIENFFGDKLMSYSPVYK